MNRKAVKIENRRAGEPAENTGQILKHLIYWKHHRKENG